MRAEVRFLANDRSDLLAEALRPEMQHEVSRTKVEIDSTGDELVIKIVAEDIVALRAAVNSYLRWTKLAAELLDVPEDGMSAAEEE